MTDLAKTSDTYLLTEYVHANREAALEALYYRYNDMIRVMLRETCSVREADLDDFLQMTWVRVLEYFDTYDPSISTQGWLFRVAFSVVRRQYVDSQCQKRLPPSPPQDITDSSGKTRPIDGDRRLPRPTSDPSELLVIRDRLEMVVEAIRGMGQQQMNAIHYVFVEGLSYKEAADLLGITRVALAATIHRVRAKLRRDRRLSA